MKKANGTGSVYKLSGKRRKPFIAVITTGYTDDGKQIREPLGYFSKKIEAETALINFYQSGVDIGNYDITFKEIFEKWSINKFKNIATTNINMYNIAYKYSTDLHDKEMKNIRTQDLENCIYSCPAGHTTKLKMRTLYNQLYEYTIKNTLADVKNFSQFIEMPKNNDISKERNIFTDKEICKLWGYLDTIEHIDTILIMIYTGFRISELLNISKKDVYLSERYIIGGNKTTAGTNRIVPIHHDILPLIEEKINQNSVYLVENKKGEKMKYCNFRREKWDKIMNDLNMKHRPHDTRHTTATLLDRYNANPISIKKILGHALTNITEKVYIHKDIKDLINAIECIEMKC